MLTFREYIDDNKLGDLRLYSTQYCNDNIKAGDKYYSGSNIVVSDGNLGTTAYKAKSSIHGNGLFARRDITEGSVIHPTHFYTERYKWVNIAPNFRFNHSSTKPNVLLVTHCNIKTIIAVKQ